MLFLWGSGLPWGRAWDSSAWRGSADVGVAGTQAREREGGFGAAVTTSFSLTTALYALAINMQPPGKRRTSSIQLEKCIAIFLKNFKKWGLGINENGELLWDANCFNLCEKAI